MFVRALSPPADDVGRDLMAAAPPSEASALLQRTRALIARYLAEAPVVVDTLALWCLHTWAHAAFDVSPRLVLHGRDVRADHARALRVLAWLTPAPRLIARATASGILSLLALERATLLLDDAAGAMLHRRDMRALIAAGARRDGTFLTARTGSQDARFRRCAAPLALATTRPPPQDMLAHAIVVPMAPALVAVGERRLPLADAPPEVESLREDFEAFAQSFVQGNEPLEATLPPFLSTAARDTWLALFALARGIGGEAGRAVLAAASNFGVPEHLTPPTSALALLRDIRRIAGVDDAPVATRAIVDELTRDLDSPWVACDWGNRLTPRGLARRLADFDLKPQVIHPPNAAAFRGYKGDALTNAFARYLDDPVAKAVLGGAAASEDANG